jgi:hypothetical protein
MDTKAFLDNLTTTATKQVFVAHLTITVTPSELENVQKELEQGEVPHLIEQGNAIRFKHNNSEYVVEAPADTLAATVEPAATPDPQNEDTLTGIIAEAVSPKPKTKKSN